MQHMFLPWEINKLTLVPQWWHKEKSSVNFDVNNMYWSQLGAIARKLLGNEWILIWNRTVRNLPQFSFMGLHIKRKRIRGARKRTKYFSDEAKKCYSRDGGVVLSAENVAFRIRKSQLAHRSAIFYEVLHLVVHPWIFRKMFDGPSAVPIHDTPNHVLELLQSVHDSPLMLTQAMFW